MIKRRKGTRKSLQKGKKLETKKPLFTAGEHTALTGGSGTPTQTLGLNFTKLVTKSTQ
ncbi:MAG: hypothetical protein WCC21_14405 [Candidatus Acidiferrales bacterium]